MSAKEAQTARSAGSPLLVSYEYAKGYLDTHPGSGLMFEFKNSQWSVMQDIQGIGIVLGYVMPRIANLIMRSGTTTARNKLTDGKVLLYPSQVRCSECGCTEERACPGGCSWTLGRDGLPTNTCSVCLPF